jgi:hypothetical protein
MLSLLDLTIGELGIRGGNFSRVNGQWVFRVETHRGIFEGRATAPSRAFLDAIDLLRQAA